MKRKFSIACFSATFLLLIAAGPAWDPSPWLADLKQFRGLVDRDYPNIDWLTGQREVSLDRWFARTADEIRQSRDDEDARRAMERLVERFNDGHLAIRWPTGLSTTTDEVPAGTSPARTPPPTIATFCAGRGYDASQVTVGTAASLPGYQAIDAGGPFPAGLIASNGRKIGVVRLGIFSPQGYPSLCEQAIANTNTPIDKHCSDICDDRLLTEAYALMTRGLMTTVERLRGAGADVLLVDLTRNGGGTEWVEAAARIISPVPLRSAPISVIPSDAWVARWRALAVKLRGEARKAPSTDRTMLIDFARRADTTADQLKPCSGEQCPHLVSAGFASGIVAELPAGRLEGRQWGPDVFSAAQYPYRDSVWNGAVIVLVDSETWSAAEQFAALFQDNGAGIVMGTRTGGAGCGHLYRNDPVTLSNSGAKLELPNCARFRKDGSNEVSGVVPDVPTGVRWNDGGEYAGRLTAAHLREAIVRAWALHQNQRLTLRAQRPE